MAYNIKAAIRAAKNMQYEPIEVKVREATNNDAWGVSTSAMSEIARATHHHDEYALLFKMVWKRLTDTEHVMHVQKALILVDFLLRNGAERFINDAKRRARDISALQKYKQYDANNRDVGGDVRAKAKNVYELLTNDAKLAEERAKAQAIKDVRLSGIGNDGYGPGDTERDTHTDKFTDGDGGDSPHDNDWDKGDHEDGDYDPNRKERDEADVEAAVEEKRKEEKKKKKKEKKDREAAAAAEGVDEEPPVEEGEKKKKKKKKKSVADASEASVDDGTSAVASTAASTAPSSSVASAATTPAFTAASASLDSYDAFAPSSHATNGTANFGSAVTFASQSASTTAGETEKPKKSRKGKKNAEAAAAPAAATSATAAYEQTASDGGDYDLTNFATSAAPVGQSSGDIDILTGTNAPTGRLEDMFSSATLMDEPLDAAGEEDDGFAVEEEPALLDMINQSTSVSGAVSPRNSGGMGSAAAEPQKPKDVWDLAQDFTNIDNLKGTVEKKKTNQREEVSMSMMRGMQPFGGGSSSSSVSAASAPAPAASSPFFGGPPAGINAFGGMGGGMGGGMVGGFGAAPMGGGFGGAPMGGMGQMGQMGMAGASPFGAPVGFGGGPAAQPGGGMAFGGMGGFGAPPQSAPSTNDLPFAAAPTAASRTKMPANGKPLVFDAVPAARQMGQMGQMTNMSAASAHHGPAGPNWNR